MPRPPKFLSRATIVRFNSFYSDQFWIQNARVNILIRWDSIKKLRFRTQVAINPVPGANLPFFPKVNTTKNSFVRNGYEIQFCNSYNFWIQNARFNILIRSNYVHRFSFRTPVTITPSPPSPHFPFLTPLGSFGALWLDLAHCIGFRFSKIMHYRGSSHMCMKGGLVI